MSDARTRALEAAAQRGETGAAEALARARARVVACDLCAGSGRVPALDTHPAVAQAVRRGLVGERLVAWATSGLTRPCPVCEILPAIRERYRAAFGEPMPQDGTWSDRYDDRARVTFVRVAWALPSGERRMVEAAVDGSAVTVEHQRPDRREWIACGPCEGRGVIYTGQDGDDEILCPACRGRGE